MTKSSTARPPVLLTSATSLVVQAQTFGIILVIPFPSFLSSKPLASPVDWFSATFPHLSLSPSLDRHSISVQVRMVPCPDRAQPACPWEAVSTVPGAASLSLPMCRTALSCFWNTPSSFLNLGLYTNLSGMFFLLIFARPTLCHFKMSA